MGYRFGLRNVGRARIGCHVGFFALALAAGCSDATERLRLPNVDAGPGDAGDVPDAMASDRGASSDADQTCARAFVEAEVSRQPVDIIWVVDNSASMAPAIAQVTAGLNDFAARIAASGIDYRVIMLSLRSATNPVMRGGKTRYGVCIPPPLAGDGACGDNERFFHVSVDIKSTQPLEQFLGTLGQTSGFRTDDDRGSDPWREHLRPGATKSIVVVTDDNARLSADHFERFNGGSNPHNSTSLPPGILDASWEDLFAGYLFHGIYGWGSETNDEEPCLYSDDTEPVSAGPTYTELVRRTGGVRAQICDGAAAWDPFFESVASAVEGSAPLACEIAIPVPPEGEQLDPSRVNVQIDGRGGDVLIGKVSNEAACGASGGWYYDDDIAPTEVRLCPASCDLARDLVVGEDTGIAVQFGCDTILI